MGIVSPPFRVVTVNGWSYPIALVCLVNAVHHSRVGYGSLFGRYEVRSKFRGWNPAGNPAGGGASPWMA